MKLVFFAIGTLAFFVAVYLSIQHPELVEGPGEKKPELEDHPLRQWDKVATWVMWGGWGCAGVLTAIDKSGFLDVAE